MVDYNNDECTMCHTITVWSEARVCYTCNDILRLDLDIGVKFAFGHRPKILEPFSKKFVWKLKAEASTAVFYIGNTGCLK